MIRLDHTLLANKCHYLALIIMLGIMSYIDHFILLFLVIFLIVIRKNRLVMIIGLVILSFLVLEIKIKELTPSKIDSECTTFIGVVKYQEKDKIYVEINKEECLLYYSEILKPGDVIDIKGTVKEPTYINDSVIFNYKSYLRNKGINYVIYPSSVKVKRHQLSIYLPRYYLVEYLKKLGKSSSDYLIPLIVGDKSLMDSDFKSSISNLGISHMFAISGLHIGLIILFLEKILGKLRKNTKDLIISLFLLFYIVITGFSPSVMRVSIVFIMAMINRIRKMSFNSLDILSLSFIFLLLVNPYYFFDISFQLSYIVTFAIYLSKDLIKGPFILKAVKVCLISLLVSFPLVGNINGKVSILSFIPNALLMTYFQSVIVPGAFLVLFLPFVEPIYEFAIYPFNKAISILNLISFNLNVPYFKPFALVIYLFLVTALLMAFDAKKRIIKPFAVLSIFLALMIYQPLLIMQNRVYFFDVSQGDSCLISLKNNGGNILIDAYGDSLEMMKRRGIKQLDYLILTHGHSDHVEEAIPILNDLNVKTLVVSKADETELTKQIIIKARKKGIRVLKVGKGDSINQKELNLSFLSPYQESSNENNNSLVITFYLDGKKYLLMGDAEEDIEKELIKTYAFKLDSDILKIGHHGSNTSTTKEFISYVSASAVVISVGRKNKYGFPDEEVLNNIKSEPSIIYRTDKDGTIIFFKNRINLFIYHILFV